MTKPHLFKIFWPLGVGIILAIFSYFFIDKAVAWAVHKHQLLENYPILNQVSLAEPTLWTIATIGLLYYIIKYLAGAVRKFDHVWFQSSLAVAIALLLDKTFKMYVHRYWFRSWLDNNPSLEQNGDFGFKFFYSTNDLIADFPSGHTAITAAFLVAFWIAYPKTRLIDLLLVCLVGAGLIAADFHYVSDVICGGLLGSYIGIFVCMLTKERSTYTQPL